MEKSLTPADEQYHIDKHLFYCVPFVCGARNLGEALRRIGEGAAMIRTKGRSRLRRISWKRFVTYGLYGRKSDGSPLSGHEELMNEAKELGTPPRH